MRQESAPVSLAKESVHYFMEHGKMMPLPDKISMPELTTRAGVFVSLKKQGELRGCIGTILPTQGCAAAEIIRNAVSAATEDPRFHRVTPEELGDLVVSVDILGAPEKISSLNELDPKKYGVIVQRGGRSGVLLPDLEGVDSAEEQVGIACRKAGIGPGEAVEMYRFQVTRYK